MDGAVFVVVFSDAALKRLLPPFKQVFVWGVFATCRSIQKAFKYASIRALYIYIYIYICVLVHILINMQAYINMRIFIVVLYVLFVSFLCIISCT